MIDEVLSGARPWWIEHVDVLEGLRGLPPGSIDLVCTSPPYNAAATDSARSHPNTSRGAHWANRGYGAHSDDMPEDEYQAWQLAILGECARVLAPGGSVCYVHKDRLNGGRLISPLKWLLRAPAPLVLRQTIVLDRGQTHNHGGYYWAPTHEYLYWLTLGIRGRHLGEGAAGGSVWQVGRETRPAFAHPAPYSLAIPRQAINALTRPGDLVLDPFSGTATTGLAAILAGRRYIGLDNCLPYVQAARLRLSQGVLALEVA